MTQSHRLDRFIDAQDEDGTYQRAVAELRAGRKRTHWMWFVFPQIRGLGHSAMSQRYAIASLDEAKAYVAHPVLGARLRECADILTGSEGASARDIFGDTDAQKLHSSMTLFARAAPDDVAFQRVLNQFFGGIPDRSTSEWLAWSSGG